MDSFVGLIHFYFGQIKSEISKWNLQTFRSLFKTKKQYRFAFPVVEDNAQQQKSDQIKILHQ
jgi:hypothetical protein